MSDIKNIIDKILQDEAVKQLTSDKEFLTDQYDLLKALPIDKEDKDEVEEVIKIGLKEANLALKEGSKAFLLRLEITKKRVAELMLDIIDA